MADQQQTLAERLRTVALTVDKHANAVTARAPEEVEVVVELYEDATTLDTLADEVETLEADAAAQREALIALTNALDYDREIGLARQQADDGLATTAGIALLERLRRAEAERDELRRLLQQQYDRARTESPTNATCDNDRED